MGGYLQWKLNTNYVTQCFPGSNSVQYSVYFKDNNTGKPIHFAEPTNYDFSKT